ncbi:GntP family permease [Robertkochia aurantiaca]|uniref:GntP family permease n=1 Tax=Robertkochia aurantiaca TaxID=2873700 RepID=UPI001CCB24A6|nr:GntP family permease [Robertkochia sp. 3YJGBD-33]
MTSLLLIFIIIVLIIVATVKFKVHPVFSLIIAALISGLATGLGGNEVMELVTRGFGNTLSGIGLVIAFGTIIGIFLEKSGGTTVLAQRVLRLFSADKSPAAMNLIGFIISIPVFCDSGFIILSSLNKALSRKTGIALVAFAVCLSTGLYATHVFVPPTPGPLAAASILGADLGRVILLGICVAIPVTIAGMLWGMFLGRRHDKLPGKSLEEQENSFLGTANAEGNIYLILSPVLLPIFLIALRSVATYPSFPLGQGWFYEIITVLGEPVLALLTGVGAAVVVTWKEASGKRGEWTVKALKEAGLIILITGAGGAFGEVLRSVGIEKLFDVESMSPTALLLSAFAISAILKSAQGSSTVAIITAAAIMAPIINVTVQQELMSVLTVLSIGAGALTVSHINDSYFWVVSQFSDLSVKEALRSHTVGTLIQGVSGILVIVFLSFILL